MSVEPSGSSPRSLSTAARNSALPAGKNFSVSGRASKSAATSCTRSSGRSLAMRASSAAKAVSRYAPVWLADVSNRITTSLGWSDGLVGRRRQAEREIRRPSVGPIREQLGV